MKQVILISALLLVSSCGVYKKYEPQSAEAFPENLYRTDVVTDTVGDFGARPWREVFTDPKLQALIDTALVHNTDLNIAKLRIEEAEATLSASKLAFLPSLALSPQGTVSSFGGERASKSYSVPVTASWQIDIFGKLRNAKEQSRMLVEGSNAYRQAVQTQLISTVATEYYRLALLHEQLEVTETTVGVWAETVRAMKLFMEEGQYTDAAVSQAEANYNSVQAQVADIKRQLAECENSLSVLIGNVPRRIECSPLESWHDVSDFGVGVPLSLLSSRPDIRQAEMNLAAAFYATNEARAAFYPSITLSGTAGWTNLAGVITNPGKILLEAIGSITQPLFQNGQLRAGLKIAKAQQEEALLNFHQSLLNIGMEVNNALTAVQTAREKSDYLQAQVAALERTVKSTKLLMEGGDSSYLEVLTAQENQLSARLSFLQNKYDEISAFISLYQALGGGKD